MKAIDTSTIVSLILTAFTIAILDFLYKLYIRPFLQVRAYRNIPGTMISFNRGSKTLWYHSNLKADPIELKKDMPFLISKNNTWLLKYPDLKAIVTNQFTRPLITVVDHEIYSGMMKNHDYYVHAFRDNIIGKLFLRHSMIFSLGNDWKRQRKLISKAFDFESMKKLVPIIEEIAKEQFGTQTFTNGKEPQHLQPIFMHVAWEVITQGFFGVNLKGYEVNGKPFADEMAIFFRSQFRAFMNPNYQIFGMKSRFWCSEVRNTINDAHTLAKVATTIIADVKDKVKKGEMKNKDGRKGILELLIESSNEGKDSLTDLELLANFFGFGFAGTDTSSQTTSNLLFCIETYPEAKEKVIKDIKEHWDEKSPLTLETLSRMEYLHALIMETLRVMTPVAGPIVRIARKDHVIGNIPVKKGYLIQPLFTPDWFSPKWIKNPDEFLPERWIKGHEDQERLKDVYTFNPFSFGPRVCIGQNLALIQIKISLCHFLTKYDIKLPEDFKLTPMYVRGISEPEVPLQLLIKPKVASN